MTKNKRISQLEERVKALETELDTLFKSVFSTNAERADIITYEEVIDQWLNGKAEK